MDAYRQRWIAAVDKNRSIGAPYWPEDFFSFIKEEMQKTDLMPIYVALYQHGVSKQLMADVLDNYHKLGGTFYKATPAYLKLAEVEVQLQPDSDRLTHAKTLEVIYKVYGVYKPQIKAARLKYQADHPGWVDK